VKASLARLQEFECASGSRHDDIIKARGTEFIGCLGEPLHPPLSVLNLDSYVGGHNCIELSRAEHMVPGDGVFFKFEFMQHMKDVLTAAGGALTLTSEEYGDFIADSQWPAPNDPAVEALPSPIRPAVQSMLDASFVLGGEGEDFMILSDPGLYFVDGSSYFDAHLKIDGDDTPYYDARDVAIKHAKRHGKDVNIHRTFHPVVADDKKKECDAMVIELGPGEAILDLSYSEEDGVPKIPVTLKTTLDSLAAAQQDGAAEPPISMAVAHSSVDCHFGYALDQTEGYPLDLNGYAKAVVKDMLMPWSKDCCKKKKNRDRFVQQFEIAFRQELLSAPDEVAGIPVPVIEVANAALAETEEAAAEELFRAQAADVIRRTVESTLRALRASRSVIARRFSRRLSRVISGGGLNPFIDRLNPTIQLGIAANEGLIQRLAQQGRSPNRDIGLARFIENVPIGLELSLAGLINSVAGDAGLTVEVEEEEENMDRLR